MYRIPITIKSAVNNSISIYNIIHEYITFVLYDKFSLSILIFE